MKTSNYAVKISVGNGINYTISKGSELYQQSLQIREYILFKMVDITVPIYKYFFKPKKSKWTITMEDLGNMEEGTVGKDWFNFYQNQQFGITDNYEEHDLSHVILGYKTSVVEETKMYCFRLGSGKKTIPTILTIIIGCIALPEFIFEFHEDYKKGKETVDFSKWDLRFLLNEQTKTLRQMVFQEEMETNHLFI